MARFVDHAPLVLFGVGLHQRWLRDFAVGLAFAGGMLLVLLVGATLSGHAAMRWTASREILPHIAGTVLVLMIAAANEEMLFRGYPLQTLIKGVGPTPAVLSISAIFGIVHGFNPNATLLGVLNTILAGVLLSLAYLKTRSLWFPYGIHIGWNAGLGVVLGFPLSGLDTASFWTTNVVEPSVFLGGAYGPEAGVIGTLIFAAGIWRVRTLRGLKVSPEVASALGGQKPARSK
jgi:membrane protease YdiL (CAAX protease family)